jgi:hypothetical protein
VGQEKTATRSGRQAPSPQPKEISPPTPAPRASKSLVERWQLWVTLLGAIIALIAGMPKIITEYRSLFPVKTATLSGSVRDPHGKPVAGAIVRAQGKAGVDTTDANGDFSFDVKVELGTQIRVTVTKDGRVGYDDLLWLHGGKTIPFDTTKTKGQP